MEICRGKRILFCCLKIFYFWPKVCRPIKCKEMDAVVGWHFGRRPKGEGFFLPFFVSGTFPSQQQASEQCGQKEGMYLWRQFLPFIASCVGWQQHTFCFGLRPYSSSQPVSRRTQVSPSILATKSSRIERGWTNR
jgi:hypothetical protein